MLVLSRKEGERILIGEDIELLVVKAGARRVKLAISAPPGVAISRAELRGSVGRHSFDEPCLPARPTTQPVGTPRT